MALQAYTFQQLKNFAEHAIGGVPDARVSSADLVNGAIEWLVSHYPWTWKTAISTCSTVAGQAYINLPDDFGELIDIVGNVLKTTAIRKASPREIARVRILGLSSDLSYLYFLGQGPQTAPNIVPPRRLEFAPIFASTVADAFILTYRRQIPTLVGNTDVPAVPYGMFEMLKWLVRGWAKQETLGDGGSDMGMARSMIEDFKAADAIADGPRTAQMVDLIQDEDPDGIYRLAPHNAILMPGDP